MIGNNEETTTLSINKNSTNLMKAVGAFMVIVSHYFRYYSVNSFFSFLSSMGYFGAALFACLSGYGVAVSYENSGFPVGGGWIRKKIKKIYIPFIFVNFLSILFVYGIASSEQSIVTRLLIGSDDYVMWYIPYILGFNFIFWLIYRTDFCKQEKIALFALICIVKCICFKICGFGSQWYTATGALFTGVLLAEFPVRVKNNKSAAYLFAFSMFLLVGGAILSKAFVDSIVIKDWMTIISGIGFCLFCLLLFGIFGSYIENMKCFNVFAYIGKNSLWVYLLHMKILFVLEKYGLLNLFLFLIGVCGISIIFDVIWKKIEKPRNGGTFAQNE